jgi:hypothetical protein
MCVRLAMVPRHRNLHWTQCPVLPIIPRALSLPNVGVAKTACRRWLMATRKSDDFHDRKPGRTIGV